MRRAFAPLTEKRSIAAYAIVELHFIWAMLQANQRANKRQEKAYHFNAKQKASLDSLEAFLDGYNNDTKAEAETLLANVFNEVYFPEEYETATDFEMPSTVFLAMQCVAKNGSYINIHLIPPIMAKLQYSIRLRALQKIVSLKENLKLNDAFQE